MHTTLPQITHLALAYMEQSIVQASRLTPSSLLMAYIYHKRTIKEHSNFYIAALNALCTRRKVLSSAEMNVCPIETDFLVSNHTGHVL